MNKRSTLLSAVVVLCSAAVLSAESASEIVKRFESQKAEALEAYRAASPNASDAGMARDALIHAYQELGEDKKISGLLQEKLASLPKGSELPPQEYFSTLQALMEILGASGDKDAAKKVLATARADVKGHAMEGKMNEFLDQLGGQLSKPGVGETIDIAYTSLQGHQVNLADMKGKVVLVDFWATWCGPCVGELPNVKKTYEAYHDKGFEVLAISLDEDKGKLESFIKENAMPWPQEFSGKGWGSPLAAKYGIQGIPATFLIGKDGKIIATDLRGGELEAAVKKALGEG